MTLQHPLDIRVKGLRRLKGWSREHLAEISGISERTISRLENNETKPQPETLMAIAQAFDLTVEGLLHEEQPNTDDDKKRNYILEFYYNGDCIEHRRSTEPFIDMHVGDESYIEFENPSYNEASGFWWVVEKRRHIKFAVGLNLETLMVHIQPIGS